jgi:hypothetical protein
LFNTRRKAPEHDSTEATQGKDITNRYQGSEYHEGSMREVRGRGGWFLIKGRVTGA